MANPKQTFLQICADLKELNCKFALIGALAVGVRARVRTTKDVDFVVAVDSDSAAEELILNLQAKGYTLRSVLEHQLSGRLATARLCVPVSLSTEPDLDLLFCACGVEAEVVKFAEPIELFGDIIAVAQLAHLLALKILAHDEARRPQDKIDILALLEKAQQKDLLEASNLLSLIKERGFNRGKDLQQEMQYFVQIAERLQEV